MKVNEVVRAFGGTTAMAKFFEVTPSAVSNWKRAGKFPDRLHYRLDRAAAERGIVLPADIFETSAQP